MAPANPMDARNDPWKKSMALKPTATVIPEKVTARPEVAMVTARASSTECPRLSSSRNRLTMKSE